MQTLPLAGLNIVVTRPREQSLDLQQGIAKLGAHALLFPLLEITPVVDAQPLQDLLSRLADFDLAIFISPNAVRYGMEAIQAAHALPSGLRFATVGKSSAQALHAAGVKDVIAPQDRSDSEALLALPELQNIQTWKIVIFRGDGGRELLGDTLKARGADVEYVSCYQRSKPHLDIAELMHAKPDAITLSSSEALGHLWDMLDEAGKAHFAALPLFVPHARIAEKARQQGWQNIIQTTGGDDGVLSGLLAWSQDISLRLVQ